LGIRSKGVNQLQFEVKGREYFLAFVEQEKKWFVLSATSQGIHRIPVYMDAVTYDRPGTLEAENYLPS
jgi:hypothetical protein